MLCKTRNGTLAPITWANTIDGAYDGNLLSEILRMPEKKPLSYDDAIKIFSEKKQEAFNAGDYGSKPGQYSWYSHNFVSYISDLGYHIEITCDELESFGVAEVRT